MTPRLTRRAFIGSSLLAPLLLSRRSHMARQVILQNSDYDLRFHLFAEVAAHEAVDESMESAEAAAATEVEPELALRASA